jgi:hypothetical protein
MAGVADKARLHLERSVPQLREWEERGIFSKVRFLTLWFTTRLALLILTLPRKKFATSSRSEMTTSTVS